MAESRKRKTETSRSPAPQELRSAADAPPDGFDPALIRRMQEIASTGLNPSAALELIIRLIAEVPAASKESMEHIKMLDKLLNTARGMMETKLRNDEAAELAGRLETLEARLAEVFHRGSEALEIPHHLDHDLHEHQ